MSLAQLTLKTGIIWQLSRVNAGGFQPTLQGIDSVQLTLSLGDFSGADDAYITELSLAASANQTIDFSSFTDLAGNTVTPTKVYAILVKPTGTGAVIQIAPGASNPLTWFFGGTTPTVSVPAGGAMLLMQTGPTTIDGTHKTLKFTNTGSGALLCDLVVITGT